MQANNLQSNPYLFIHNSIFFSEITFLPQYLQGWPRAVGGSPDLDGRGGEHCQAEQSAYPRPAPARQQDQRLQGTLRVCMYYKTEHSRPKQICLAETHCLNRIKYIEIGQTWISPKTLGQTTRYSLIFHISINSVQNIPRSVNEIILYKPI